MEKTALEEFGNYWFELMPEEGFNVEVDWYEIAGKLAELKEVKLKESLLNFLTWHESENLGCFPDGLEGRVEEYLKLLNQTED